MENTNTSTTTSAKLEVLSIREHLEETRGKLKRARARGDALEKAVERHAATKKKWLGVCAAWKQKREKMMTFKANVDEMLAEMGDYGEAMRDASLRGWWTRLDAKHGLELSDDAKEDGPVDDRDKMDDRHEDGLHYFSEVERRVQGKADEAEYRWEDATVLYNRTRHEQLCLEATEAALEMDLELELQH